MSPEVEQLIEWNVQDVAKIIMREQDCSIEEALTSLYSSRVYDGLADPETGLYLQSPSYLYEVYQELS